MPNARDVPNRDLLDELALSFGEDPEVAIATMFQYPGLRVGGKVFAFLTHEGQLIIKVPRERGSQLVEAGTASQVTMGKRTMQEWFELSPPRDPASTLDLWTVLANEAHRYVSELKAST